MRLNFAPFSLPFLPPPRPLPAQGPPGEPGKPGAPGKPGTPGADVSSGCWGHEARPSVCVCVCVCVCVHARVSVCEREKSAACRQLWSKLRRDWLWSWRCPRAGRWDAVSARGSAERGGAPRSTALACAPLCSASSGGYPFLPVSGCSPLTPLRGCWGFALVLSPAPPKWV